MGENAALKALERAKQQLCSDMAYAEHELERLRESASAAESRIMKYRQDCEALDAAIVALSAEAA